MRRVESGSCGFAQRRRSIRQILRDEPITERLSADIDQVLVVGQHDDLRQPRELAEGFEYAL